MKKLLVAAVLASSLGSAQAWGQREQGALAGVVGTMLLQHMTRQQTLVRVPVYQIPRYEPQAHVHIQQQRPLQCWQTPVRDYTGAIVTYVQQCF